MVLFSICIPTFNRPECIRLALERYVQVISAHNAQDEVEVCISDNSENDATEKIAHEFSKKIRHLAYSRNGKNIGYDANNIKAVSLASGDYIITESDEFLFSQQVLGELLSLLKSERPEIVYMIAHHTSWGGYKRLFASHATNISAQKLSNMFLNMDGVHHRTMTHLTMFVFRRFHFQKFLQEHKENIPLFYFLSFVQTSYYFYCLSQCKEARIYKKREFEEVLRPKKLDVYMPSDISNILIWKYFYTIILCHKFGILSDSQISAFKRHYLLDLFSKMLRVRAHLSPAIYQSEIPTIRKNLHDVRSCYGKLAGFAISAWEAVVFTPLLPYHWLYLAYLFFKRASGAKMDNLLELYEKLQKGESGTVQSWKKTGF